VIVTVVGLAWIGQLALRTDGEASETAWIPYPSVEYAAGALLGVSGAAGLGVLLAALGLWTLRKARERRLAVWLGAWALGPFLLALAISLARPVFLDRYLVIATPAFAMLCAVAVFGLAARLRVGVLVVAAAATSLALVFWYQSVEDGNWRGEDWRGAVATVNDRRADGDAVVVVPWWAHDAAEYYGAEATSVSGADSIWVLHWSEEGTQLPASVRRPLGFGDHELVETRQFGWRVSAQLWRRRG
jgi:hypothetical protein